MEVLQDPPEGICSVTPPFGYGFITYFDIVCTGFGSEDRGDQRALEFEYVQFSEVSDRKNSRMFLGRSFGGMLENMTLAPGFERHNYVTIVMVYARNKAGFVQISVFNL